MTDAQGDADNSPYEERAWCYNAAGAIRMRRFVGVGVGWNATKIGCICG